MDLTVYRVADGCFVLVPACFQPSMACRRQYGALGRCGQVGIDEALCSIAWQRVIDEIDRNSYALVTPQDADLLLGAGHRCLQAGSVSSDRLQAIPAR